MSVERVQVFLDERASGLRVTVTEADTSTVTAAAAALGVEPGQIAKSLAVRAGEFQLLLVTSGDTRLDNAKFKARFGTKPRMLGADETQQFTGQPVGGVSPFAHSADVPIFCDESLHAYDVVHPAGGSPNSMVRVEPDQLAEIVGAEWVDVTR